jgi:hypothetical protein
VCKKDAFESDGLRPYGLERNLRKQLSNPPFPKSPIGGVNPKLSSQPRAACLPLSLKWRIVGYFGFGDKTAFPTIPAKQ